MGQIRKWTEAVITRFEKEGRGTGEGADYSPWVQIGDFASLGRTHEIWSAKTGRTHHLFSDGERDFFYILEWAQDVVGIREQFPLPRKLTLDAALRARIAHPYYPGTHVPTVMTVDFLVTRVRNGALFHQAFDVKDDRAAEDVRVVEKLEIQRTVCAQLGYAHRLAFRSMIPRQVADNIGWIRGAQLGPYETEPSDGFFRDHQSRMHRELQNRTASGTLVDFCLRYDRSHGLEGGTGLRIARMLMQSRALMVDLECTDIPRVPLATLVSTALRGELRSVEASS